MVRQGSGSRAPAGRGGGGSGMARSFVTPVLVVAVIVLVVLGFGYWGKLSPAKETAGTAKPPVGKEPAKEQPQAQQPVKQEPTAPANPNAEVLEKRKRIDRAGGAAETMLLTLYFVDGLTNATTIQPVEVRIASTKSVVRAVAENLVQQPSDLKLYSNVPAGTKVRSVNFDAKTGVATVDLSAEAGAVQGTEAAMNMRASFVYSLTALKDVKAVQLWVNGKPAVLHGILWDTPISRQQMDERSPYKMAPVVKFAGS